MRKICVILTIHLCIGILSSCTNFGTKESIAESTHTATENSTSKSATEMVSTGVTELADQQRAELLADQFLKYMQNKDIKNIISLICVEYTDGGDVDTVETELKYLEAYSFIRDVNIESYKILKTESFNDYLSCDVELNIPMSDNELFPVGKSNWILKINYSDITLQLFKLTDKTINIITGEEQGDVVDFCCNFSSELKFYKTCTDFNEIVPDLKDNVSYNYFCERLIRCLKLPVSNYNEYDREELSNKAKSLFGITNVDFSMCSEYDNAKDTVHLNLVAGSWVSCSLKSEMFNSATNQHTIIIDYYSDTAYILKTKTVKYIVGENKDKSFTLLSTELLFDLGVPIAGGLI